jgi:hypothetical protein
MICFSWNSIAIKNSSTSNFINVLYKSNNTIKLPSIPWSVYAIIKAYTCIFAIFIYIFKNTSCYFRYLGCNYPYILENAPYTFENIKNESITSCRNSTICNVPSTNMHEYSTCFTSYAQNATWNASCGILLYASIICFHIYLL